MKVFYRNGLMRAPTRAREISFTFTPAQGLPTFVEWGDGLDSLAANVTHAPEPMPFAAAVNRAPTLTPIAFSARGAPPLVGKETTLSKSCGSAGVRSGGNGGGERSVHTGTTKD